MTGAEHPLTESYFQELAETMEKHLDLEALLEMLPRITRAGARDPDPELRPGSD